MIKRFLKGESGAVPAEWVTIAAGTLGLGIAAATSIGMGALNMGNNVSSALGGSGMAALESMKKGMDQLIAMTFADGNFCGWSADREGYSPALGNFLGPFAGSDAMLTFDLSLPMGAEAALMAFDLLILDSWDGNNPQWSRGRGDGMAVSINNTEIAFELFQHGSAMSNDRHTTATVGDTTYTLTMTQTSAGRKYGNQWPDEVWRVTIAAENPPGHMQLGLKATTDQGIHDESFGVGYFTASAR